MHVLMFGLLLVVVVPKVCLIAATVTCMHYCQLCIVVTYRKLKKILFVGVGD